jgi:hypothetical protein
MSDCDYILSSGEKLNYNQMRKHLLDNYDKLQRGELKAAPKAPPSEPAGRRERKVFKSFLERKTNLDAEQRDRIQKNPNRYYDPISYDEPRAIAREIIEDIGYEQAELAATEQIPEESSSYPGSLPAVVKMAILGEAVLHYGNQSLSDKEIDSYDRFESAFQNMAALGTQYGQAISQLKAIYRLSGLARVERINRKTIRDIEDSGVDVDERKQEVIDALMKDLEGLRNVEKDFEEKLSKLAGQKLSEDMQGLVDGLDDYIKSLEKSGRLYDATLGIPIEIFIGGLKMLRYTLIAGRGVIQAIENAIEEIKRLLSEKGIEFKKEKELRELLKSNPIVEQYLAEERQKRQPPPAEQRGSKAPPETPPSNKKRIDALDEYAERIPLSDGSEDYVKGVIEAIQEARETVTVGNLSLGKGAVAKLVQRILAGEKLDINNPSVSREILQALKWNIPQTESQIIQTLSDELLNNAELPIYIRRQYEEILQFIVSFNEREALSDVIDSSIILSNLSGIWNNLVNVLGGLDSLYHVAGVAIRTKDFDAFKVAAKEFRYAYYEASTIFNIKLKKPKISKKIGDIFPFLLGGGRVSRGVSYKDQLEQESRTIKTGRGVTPSAVTGSIGEASVRSLEYMPSLGVKGQGGLLSGITSYLYTSKPVLSQKYIGRLLEAADTFPSAVVAGTADYYKIKRYIERFYPKATPKERAKMIFDAMYSANGKADYDKAKFDLIASGVPRPTKAEIERTVYERLVRARDRNLKEMYDLFYEEKKKEAKQYLVANQLPVDEDQIKKYANIFAGTFTPVVGAGQMEAQRMTGKISTNGIVPLFNWFFTVLKSGLQQRVRMEKRAYPKAILKTTERFINLFAFPFQESSGRWAEMALELGPYGIAKGLAYKVSAITSKNEREKERINDMSTGFLLRGAIGSAIVIAYLVSSAKGDDDDDTGFEFTEDQSTLQGFNRAESWKAERVASARNPKQSIKVGEDRRFPLLLLGTIGVALTWAANVRALTNRKIAEKSKMTAEEQEWVMNSTNMIAAIAIIEETTKMAYEASFLKNLLNYGKMTADLAQGKQGAEEKMGQRIGRMMASNIPYNRLQQEMGQLMNPASQTYKGFATNVANQFSIVRGFGEGKKNFDYLGREYDDADIYLNSTGGLVKFITGSKYREEIDEWLVGMNFTLSDAYRSTKADKIGRYSMIKNGAAITMTDDEWYEWEYTAANMFKEDVERAYQNKKSVIESLPKDEQRGVISELLNWSRVKAAAKLNKYSDPQDYLDMIQEKREDAAKDKTRMQEVIEDLLDN